jgi:hypothetical protein
MTIPEAGTLVPTREARDLAKAVVDVARRGPPRWPGCRG